MLTIDKLNIPQFKNERRKATDFYHKKGFHIEENVFTPQECKELINTCKELDSYKQKKYIPEQQIHNINSFSFKMMKNNLILSFINEVASNGYEMYGIQSSYFYGVPGTSGASKHQDGLWVQPEDANGFISAWTALVDMEVENMGNLFVYEESHKQGNLEVLKNENSDISYQNKGLVNYESVLRMETPLHKITLKRGSTVFLHSQVVHGSVANTSEVERNAILFTYIRDGISFRKGREAKREKTKLI